MDRVAYNAMLAQYATPEVSGDGRVSWDGGVRCVIPEVKLYGKCEQETLTGKNLFHADWIVEQINAGNFITDDDITYKQTVEIPVANGLYTLMAHNRISGKGVCLLSVNKRVNSSSAGTIGLSPTFSDYNVVTVENGALYIGCNSSVENFIYLVQNCMVQIEVGGKPTSYEPYCGGIPAPNPSYPVPIKCNNGVFRVTNAAGEYDGGQATAPELYAIPGTEYRDEWDAQTGQGVRRCAIIESYAGESITTPYISSTGELSEGATVVYGIPDTPFYATPARLTMPPGAGQIIQVGGDVADCPITARYLTHS